MSDCTTDCISRPVRSALYSRLVLLFCATLLLLAAASSAEARTRKFCRYEHFSGFVYSGKNVSA